MMLWPRVAAIVAGATLAMGTACAAADRQGAASPAASGAPVVRTDLVLPGAVCDPPRVDTDQWTSTVCRLPDGSRAVVTAPPCRAAACLLVIDTRPAAPLASPTRTAAP